MKNIQKYSVYILAYTLWVVSLVGGFWVLLRLREALISMLVVMSLDRYQSDASERFNTALQMKAAESWSYLFIGLILIVLIVVLESVFRTGAQKGQVWQRFSLVLAVELGVLFLSELVISLSAGAVQPLSWGDFVVPVIYLIPAALFGWLWASIRPRPSTA